METPEAHPDQEVPPELEGDLEGAGVLTFTANRRAHLYAVGAAIAFAAAIGLIYASVLPGFPMLSAWWCVFPLLVAIGCLFFAWDAARHPYLLLDGEGLIQYPFSEESIKTAWAHIDEFEVKEAVLQLQTTNPLASKKGDHVLKEVDLAPLRRPQRDLLLRAIESQVVFAEEEREEDESAE